MKRDTHGTEETKWYSIRVALTGDGGDLEYLANGEDGSKDFNQGGIITLPLTHLPVLELCGLLLDLFKITFTYSIIWLLIKKTCYINSFIQ